MDTMKYYNRLMEEYQDIKVYKIYTLWGIAITEATPPHGRYKGYILTDYFTGIFAGKRFRTLKEAKLFMESPDTEEFTYWYHKVKQARLGTTYKELLRKYRKGERM